MPERETINHAKEDLRETFNYSTSCKFRPIRTLFTRTVHWLIKSWVVILFPTNERVAFSGQM